MSSINLDFVINAAAAANAVASTSIAAQVASNRFAIRDVITKSWGEESVGAKLFCDILLGEEGLWMDKLHSMNGKPNGLTFEVHGTNVLMKHEGGQICVRTGLEGKDQFMIIDVPAKTVEVKAEYFTKQHWLSGGTLDRIMVNDKAKTVSQFVNSPDSNGDVKSWKMLKLFLAICNKEVGLNKLSALKEKPHLVMNVAEVNKQLRVIKPMMVDGSMHTPVVHWSPISEEHALSGFSAKRVMDSIFIKHNMDTQTYLSIESPNKANARATKLVGTGICLGKYKVIVLDLGKDHPLANWFNTGAVYVPRSFIEQYGFVRLVNQWGIKGVTTPMPSTFKVPKDTIIVSAGSFKGGDIGVAAAMGCDVFEASKADLSHFIGCNTTNVNLAGYDVTGYITEQDINGTLFYSLFGLTEMDDLCEDDFVTSYTSGSYYLHAEERLKEAHESGAYDYQLVSELMMNIEAGNIKRHNNHVAFTMQDFQIAWWSYGKDIAEEFVSSVVSGMDECMQGKRNLAAMQSLFYKSNPEDKTTVSFKYDHTVLAELDSFCATKGVKIDGARMKPAHMKALTEGFTMVDGTMFPGIFNMPYWSITVNGYEFFMPNGDVMKSFISPADDVDGEIPYYYISGPVKDLVTLLIAFRNKNTNWKSKWMSHNHAIQKELYGKNMGRFYAEGSYRAILPAPWLGMDEVTMINEETSRMTYSKLPTLFHASVTDVNVKSSMPVKLYGKMSAKFEFAAQSVVFVNPELLLNHQDDCDGDLARLTNTGGVLPLYSGQPVWQKKWVNEYVSGESDLRIKEKEFKQYSFMDFHNGLLGSMQAKENLGIFSANLYQVEFVLNRAVISGQMQFEYAQVIKEVYAMLIQDEAMRAVKHTQTGEAVSNAISVRNIIQDRTGSVIVDLANIIHKYTGIRSIEMKDAITTFIGACSAVFKGVDYLNRSTSAVTERNHEYVLKSFAKEDASDNIAGVHNIWQNAWLRNNEYTQPNFLKEYDKYAAGFQNSNVWQGYISNKFYYCKGVWNASIQDARFNRSIQHYTLQAVFNKLAKK